MKTHALLAAAAAFLVALGCNGRRTGARLTGSPAVGVPAVEVPAEAQVQFWGGRYVEITTPDGKNRYLWCEMTGDERLLRQQRARGKNRERGRRGPRYAAMGICLNRGIGPTGNMPAAPGMEVQLSVKPPADDAACWFLSAAAVVDGCVYAYALPIPPPYRQWYIGMPPHPSRREVVGQPWQGGVVRVPLRGGPSERWAHELPEYLLCRNGDTAKYGGGLQHYWGPAVIDIRKERGQVVLTSMDLARVAFDPATGAWTVLNSDRPRSPVDLLRVWRNYPSAGVGIGTAGVRRLKEAVPYLVDALAGSPYRRDAAVALVQIGDTSCIPALQKLARSDRPGVCSAANTAISGLAGPFSPPVEGLSFRLVPHDSPLKPGEKGWVGLLMRNESRRPVAFCYSYPCPQAGYMVGEIRPVIGGRWETVQPKEASKPIRCVLEPGQAGKAICCIGRRKPGRYRVRLTVSVSGDLAGGLQKREGWQTPAIWSGWHQSNEVTLEWRRGERSK